jgi:hypothetical protein
MRVMPWEYLMGTRRVEKDRPLIVFTTRIQKLEHARRERVDIPLDVRDTPVAYTYYIPKGRRSATYPKIMIVFMSPAKKTGSYFHNTKQKYRARIVE